MKLDCDKIGFSYGSVPVLKDISFSMGTGELVSVLGPNGVGKSTLFKCLLGFLKPSEGRILINGKNLNLYSRRELSREIAYIPQSYNPSFDFTVLDSVLMGCASTLKGFLTPTKEHRDRAMSILEKLGIGKLANRGSAKISGGERQLMLLARALLQNANILIMDEPTASLDLGNCALVMKNVKNLCDCGYAVLFSTHDPSQALQFSSRILTIKNGTILTDTTPRSFSSNVLKTLYNVDVEICESCGGARLKL